MTEIIDPSPLNHSGTGIDDDGHYRSINIKSFWYKDDPYIPATQARKSFYLQDTSLGKDWWVVQKFEHRDMYDVNEIEHQVHCWRSLTIKFDRQFISKTGKINTLIAHIHLLLTYFHMYWILSVLQDIYMKYMGSMVKVHKPKSIKQILQKHKQKPKQLTHLGQTLV